MIGSMAGEALLCCRQHLRSVPICEIQEKKKKETAQDDGKDAG